MADTRLSWFKRMSYGGGHVLNDLCASMWFSYLLVFLHYVMCFSNSLAGYLMLLGQVADALSTPFVGIESDRTRRGCFGYGRRKSWHLLGTVCVALSFPFLFNQCIGCAHAMAWEKLIYYAPFVVIFQFGWASTQISHLSLIPEITSQESERVELNAIRYAFTVIANIIVYVLTWLLLYLHHSGGIGGRLSPNDAPQFRNLVFIVVGMGLLSSTFFHVGTKEKLIEPSVRHGEESEVSSPCGDKSLLPRRRRMKVRDWFKEPQFYLIAVIYMCTRLIYNILQVYIPLYVTDSLRMGKIYIAIIPLVIFVSGFITSVVMKPINRRFGRKVTFIIGAVIILLVAVWLFCIAYFLPGPCHAQTCPVRHIHSEYQVFGAAALVGIGGSTILVTSLSMTADLIGQHTEGSAFVYGAMSFTDKLSNGIAVAVIQNIHPCKDGEVCCPACRWFYQYVVSTVPGAFAIVALVTVCVLLPMTLGALRADKPTTDSEREPLLREQPLSDEDESAVVKPLAHERTIANDVMPSVDRVINDDRTLTSRNAMTFAQDNGDLGSVPRGGNRALGGSIPAVKPPAAAAGVRFVIGSPNSAVSTPQDSPNVN